MDTQAALATVNRYLKIMLTDNNHGQGLEEILTDDFIFDDPFNKTSTAREFVAKTQPWITTRKTFRMDRQFVEGDRVCSTYRIDVATPSGATVGFDLVDIVEFRGSRIAREWVYFANPVQFAKEMGFLSAYLKAFGV